MFFPQSPFFPIPGIGAFIGQCFDFGTLNVGFFFGAFPAFILVKIRPNPKKINKQKQFFSILVKVCRFFYPAFFFLGGGEGKKIMDKRQKKKRFLLPDRLEKLFFFLGRGGEKIFDIFFLFRGFL